MSQTWSMLAPDCSTILMRVGEMFNNRSDEEVPFLELTQRIAMPNSASETELIPFDEASPGDSPTFPVYRTPASSGADRLAAHYTLAYFLAETLAQATRAMR